MSQPADWGVPLSGPETPVAYATRDDDSLDALLSGHIGASRPAYAVQGTFWLKDTGASPQVIEKYFYDGTNDILISTFDVATSKVSFTNFVGSPIASAATIVIPSDGDYFSLTGSVTISTMTLAINRSFTLKSVSGLTLTAGAPIVTIDGNDLVLAAGQTVTLQSTAADTVQVVSVGSIGGAGGKTLQMVSSIDGALQTGATAIPNDDSIPQNDEGDQFYSIVITPISSTSNLLIEVVVQGADAATGLLAAALFVDSVANALATSYIRQSTSARNGILVIRYVVASASTSARTYKVRAGNNGAAVFTLNGKASARLYGGTFLSGITVTEFEA